MNELITANTEVSSLALIAADDPFLLYADAVAPVFIIGKLLRFSKGDYFAGESGMEIPVGTTVTVNVDELMAGWIKWANGKPAEHRMVRIADGKPPQKRGDLGDFDQTLWEIGADGERRDPWQFSNYLPMMGENGELFTFTTSSRGGLNAVADVVRRYGRHRKHHPDVFPLIKLNVGAYQHPNKEYGRIKFPDFFPDGWAPKTAFAAAMAAAGYISTTEPEIESVVPSLADEMSDEIPF
jgi:hypothetical protein